MKIDLSFIKNPIFIILCLITVSLIILVIISTSNPRSNCDSKTHVYNDKYGCLDKCSSNTTKRCGATCYDPTKKCCVKPQNSLQDLCGGVCCQNNTCITDDLTGTKSCCSSVQYCPNRKDSSSPCCPADSVCKDGSCVILCGTKENPRTCDEKTQTCGVMNIQKGTKIYESLKDNSNYSEGPSLSGSNYSEFRTCIANTAGKCFESVNSAESPAKLNGRYPCFEIPKKDNYPGLGFCTSNNIDTASSESVVSCNNHKSIVDCNQDLNCKWYDILETDTPTVSELNNAISKTFKSGGEDSYGHVCSDTTYPMSYYGQKFSNTKCGTYDCLKLFSQTGVTDINFDSKTNMCNALINCKNAPIITDSGEIINLNKDLNFNTCILGWDYGKKNVNYNCPNPICMNGVHDGIVEIDENNVANCQTRNLPSCSSIQHPISGNFFCDPTKHNSFTYNSDLICDSTGNLIYGQQQPQPPLTPPAPVPSSYENLPADYKSIIDTSYNTYGENSYVIIPYYGVTFTNGANRGGNTFYTHVYNNISYYTGNIINSNGDLEAYINVSFNNGSAPTTIHVEVTNPFIGTHTANFLHDEAFPKNYAIFNYKNSNFVVVIIGLQ